jgi:O-antigen/teichoic acid export membrane protein
VLLISGFGIDKTQVGFYKASASVGIALYFILVSITQVAYPLMSKLYAQKAWSELKRVVNTLLLGFVFLTSLAFIFTNLFSLEIIKLIFGNSYEPAAAVLPWYVLGIGLLCLVILLGNMMISFEHKPTYLIYLSFALLVYVVLVSILVATLELLAPPVSLIIISMIIIGLLIYFIDKKDRDLINKKRTLLNTFWLFLLATITILLNRVLVNYVNPYVVSVFAFVFFLVVSLITSREVRISALNSASLLLRVKK